MHAAIRVIFVGGPDFLTGSAQKAFHPLAGKGQSGNAVVQGLKHHNSARRVIHNVQQMREGAVEPLLALHPHIDIGEKKGQDAAAADLRLCIQRDLRPLPGFVFHLHPDDLSKFSAAYACLVKRHADALRVLGMQKIQSLRREHASQLVSGAAKQRDQRLIDVQCPINPVLPCKISGGSRNQLQIFEAGIFRIDLIGAHCPRSFLYIVVSRRIPALCCDTPKFQGLYASDC